MTGHQQLALAYPHADTLVRDYFLIAPGAADEWTCKAYFRSFLAALFTEARLSAQAIVPEGQVISYADMAHAFYDLFNEWSRRTKFYNAVVTSRDPPADPWKAFDELHDLLKQRCSDWLPSAKCPILISMDEIHILCNPRGQDTEPPHTLYSRLKSVVSEGVSEKFCVIVMSTATSIGKRAPAREVAPSMRERDAERNLPVPFTELPFDVHVIADPLLPGRASLGSVGTLAFTAKFGRPLWVHVASKFLIPPSDMFVHGAGSIQLICLARPVGRITVILW